MQKLAGKMMNLTSDSMDVYINLCRGGIDTGGRMTQQRTLHNLRSLSKAKLVGWNARLEDQLCLVHAAGARGFDAGSDWVVPLESDPDFADIVVNTVLPPTVNRRFFAGTATSAANIATTDELRLEDVDVLRATLDDMAYPMTPIKLMGDVSAEEDPLFCLYVTSRQWHWIQTNTTQTVWRTFLQNAHDRSTMFKHPVFLGQRGMWNGILIKKLWRPIRFPTGSDVVENDAGDLTTTTVQTAVDVDRALLFGAEAVGIVYGRHQDSDFYYNWHEEKSDHGNTLEVSTASMSGKSKIRFKGTDGTITDHGVMTIDSYAKAP
ncbi:MAG TPA: DUF4043 family protein [Gammaproteobacteria bacterium]|nr:DUF4043 family protein [Gammaproteobacteria bacterium]